MSDDQPEIKDERVRVHILSLLDHISKSAVGIATIIRDYCRVEKERDTLELENAGLRAQLADLEKVRAEELAHVSMSRDETAQAQIAELEKENAVLRDCLDRAVAEGHRLGAHAVDIMVRFVDPMKHQVRDLEAALAAEREKIAAMPH